MKTTDHPPVPRELSQFWMAPDTRRPRTAAQANLATAVKFENEGNHAKALNLVTNPATKQDGPLAAYAEFYKGIAQLRLGRAADAVTRRFDRYFLTFQFYYDAVDDQSGFRVGLFPEGLGYGLTSDQVQGAIGAQ